MHAPLPPPSHARGLRGIFHAARAFQESVVSGEAFGDATRARKLVLRNLRVGLLVIRLEVYDRIKLHAQALTLATLLALVPTLAVIFAIVKGFGGLDDVYADLERWILSNISGSAELHATISGYLRQFVANIQGGSLGAVSIVILLVSVLSLLQNIETSFNTVFGLKTERPLGIRLLIYWAILTVGPLLLGGSLAVTAAVSSSRALAWTDDLGVVSRFFVGITPILISWLGFGAMYFLIPATRVRFSSALWSGLATALLWTAAKAGFALYVKNAATVTDIYGSLATIPMFILWLHVSWLLVLFGAQLCFALQNAATFEPTNLGEPPSTASLKLITSRLLLEVGRDFSEGGGPTDVQATTDRLGLARQHIEGAVEILRGGGFVRDAESGGLLPARDLSGLYLADLWAYIDAGRGQTIDLPEDEARQVLLGLAQEVDAAGVAIGRRRSIRDLLETLPRTPSPTAPPTAPSP